MANLLQLINKSSTMDKKAKAIVDDTIVDLKRNRISSRPQMLHAIYTAMRSFYESIGKPNMKPRYAKDFPSSKDYNDTMNEIKSDMEIINLEYQTLDQVLQAAYSQVEIDRITISNLIDNTTKKYEKALSKMQHINSGSIFVDSFISLKYFDKDACVKDAVTVNTNYKYISLATESFEGLNDKASIAILDGSNGFSGNTHQVNLVNNDVKFVGDQGLKINLASVLDNNSETWFEYELYKINEEDKLQCLNLGFNYDEGIKWITDGNLLIHHLSVTFDIPQLMNTITMAPFIAPDKDAAPALIKQITVSDGKGTIRNILNDYEEFDSNKTYYFPKQYCKEVKFVITQELTYRTAIGHMYFKEVGARNMDFFKKKEDNNSFRVDGNMPSVQNLGMLYDDRQRHYLQPVAKYGDIIAEEQIIKNNLFTVPSDTNTKQSYIETLEANRFLIGIRDIAFSIYSYKSESEYVSVNYEAKKPITSVTMSANEFIPDVFSKDSDWIKYYISVNNGVEWHPIIPIGLYKQNGFNRYLINSGISREFRSSDIGYIETAEPVYNIKVKIELLRPVDIVDAEYFSPIVYEYKLFA